MVFGQREDTRPSPTDNELWEAIVLWSPAQINTRLCFNLYGEERTLHTVHYYFGGELLAY